MRVRGAKQHRQRGRTVEVDQIQSQVVVLSTSRNQNAGLCLFVKNGRDRGHGVHENTPVAKGNDYQRDGDPDILVPDGNGTEP